MALIQGHAAGFDFIASERGISNVRAGQIKSIVVSRGHHELVQIFQKLDKQVPEVISKQLVAMLNQGLDVCEITNFILKYIEI